MRKKAATYFSLTIIILFIIFIIYDTYQSSSTVETETEGITDEDDKTRWTVKDRVQITQGKLKAVGSGAGSIVVGGENFIARYDNNLSLQWRRKTEQSVYALSVYGNTIYASTGEKINLVSLEGDFVAEWGPYDESPLITSVSAGKDTIAIADANNGIVFILNKDGGVISFFGQPGNQFIIPSPYFDLAFSDEDTLAVVNPGKRRIEIRNREGQIIHTFGETGIDPQQFTGCCNPSHIAFLPDGTIVTSEKGINRIKILDKNDVFIELVAQLKLHKGATPPDIATDSAGRIFAANGNDSVLYIYERVMK